jgi:hypothetical protein
MIRLSVSVNGVDVVVDYEFDRPDEAVRQLRDAMKAIEKDIPKPLPQAEKAGALILAEMERMLRLQQKTTQ